jgi:photosynthetic reaction center cytochrome c subunit
MTLQKRNGIRVWSTLILAISVVASLWLARVAWAQDAKGTNAPGTKPKMSDEAFTNVKALKGIPLDDFMGTMGVMTSSLGFDCSECHVAAGTQNVDWAADTQRKVMARKMITMVNTINHDNFSGRQVITCYSCHRGRDRPLTTATIENVYGSVPVEMDDVLAQEDGQPAADQIIDKYIGAIGGAEKLASIKSFIATGVSKGFGGFGGGARVTIYAKSPDRRKLIMDFKDAPGRGDTTRVYDGQRAWLRTPLNVLGEYELSGGELAGARLDAQMAFPAQVKQLLTRLRVSLPTTISDIPSPSSQSEQGENVVIGQDRLVDVVQGSTKDLLVTLYFDHESGLLLREVRYANTPIGRVPTLTDYGDYRSVGGIKMPFRMTFAWFNGRDDIRLNEVRANVPIDQEVFGKPAPAKVTGSN